MFDIEFTSEPLAVRGALSDVMNGLSPLSMDGDELGTIELVLAEALNNVVEHAYPDGDPAGPVNISCQKSDKGLLFRVVDIGRPMPDGQVPLGQQANVDVDMYDLPEGGFGWFLIRDLAKDITYRHDDGKNVLELRMAVALNA